MYHRPLTTAFGVSMFQYSLFNSISDIPTSAPTCVSKSQKQSLLQLYIRYSQKTVLTIVSEFSYTQIYCHINGLCESVHSGTVEITFETYLFHSSWYKWRLQRGVLLVIFIMALNYSEAIFVIRGASSSHSAHCMLLSR